jgi:hypothetical protein
MPPSRPLARLNATPAALLTSVDKREDVVVIHNWVAEPMVAGTGALLEAPVGTGLAVLNAVAVMFGWAVFAAGGEGGVWERRGIGREGGCERG